MRCPIVSHGLLHGHHSGVESGRGQSESPMSQLSEHRRGKSFHVLVQSRSVHRQGTRNHGGCHICVGWNAGHDRCTGRPVTRKAPPAGHLLEHGNLACHHRGQWSLEDVGAELQGRHSSIHSVGESGLVTSGRQQAKPLPPEGRGVCRASSLVLVLAHRGGGQVTIRSDEGKARRRHETRYSGRSRSRGAQWESPTSGCFLKGR